MTISSILADFKAKAQQCESLIANSHQLDAHGTSILPAIDREQITTAAFLNMFIAWEAFLEASFAELMVGATTLNGVTPVKYASPPDSIAARKMLIGVMNYFDYGNHENVRNIAKLYFKDGHPYEKHISSVHSHLSDIKTMRNFSAHISSTTQSTLDGLALRIFGRPMPGIALYAMLTSVDPRSTSGETVFGMSKTILVTTAELIATG